MWVERLGSIAALFVLAACADVAHEVREHTYPRDFEYLTQGEIQGAMGQLAAQVRSLDLLLAEGAPRTDERRREVVERLETMERIARSLGTGDVRSNHPRLDEGIDAFRERLASARRAAQADPPNYYLAGSVSGACRYCHH
jgi:hypothetical protein